LPYALKLADLGYQKACREDPNLARGIDVEKGKVTNKAVAEFFDMEWAPSSVSG
jgi:alanine dehydrogenase